MDGIGKKIRATCPACKHEGSPEQPHAMMKLDEKFDDGQILHSDVMMQCGSCGLQFNTWTVNKKTHKITEHLKFEDGSSILMRDIHIFDAPDARM